MTAALTLHELPDLLGGARVASQPAAGGAIGAESVIDRASGVESLLRYLGRPHALRGAVAARERGAAALKDSGWSHARCLARSTTIDRLIDAGRAAEAVQLARWLVLEATAAGEAAYEVAAYDLAMRHFSLGQAIRKSGEAQAVTHFTRPALGSRAWRTQAIAVPPGRPRSAGLSEPMSYWIWAGSKRRPRRTRKPSSLLSRAAIPAMWPQPGSSSERCDTISVGIRKPSGLTD